MVLTTIYNDDCDQERFIALEESLRCNENTNDTSNRLCAYLESQLTEHFQMKFIMSCSYDIQYARWVIRADVGCACVTKEILEEDMRPSNFKSIGDMFIQRFELSIPKRFRKREVIKPNADLKLFRCECCNAILSSPICEYCGATYHVI